MSLKKKNTHNPHVKHTKFLYNIDSLQNFTLYNIKNLGRYLKKDHL